MAPKPEVSSQSLLRRSGRFVRSAAKVGSSEDFERNRPGWLQGVVTLLLIVGAVIYAFPFFWMVSTSLKIPENIYLDPPQWFPDPVAWTNYVDIFDVGPVWSWIHNSTLITVVSVLARTLSSVLVAYGFARFNFPGSLYALLSFAVEPDAPPGHVTIIPRFLMFRDRHWPGQNRSAVDCAQFLWRGLLGLFDSPISDDLTA